MGNNRSTNYPFLSDPKECYYVKLKECIGAINIEYKECKNQEERDDFYKLVLKEYKRPKEMRNDSYKQWTAICYGDFCRIIKPAGLVYYIEIEIIKMNLFGSIGAINPASAFYLMNSRRGNILELNEYAVYWESHHIRIKCGGGIIREGDRSVIKEDGAICGDYEYRAGDVIGIMISNDRKDIYFIKNGCIMHKSYNPGLTEILFYVDFHDAVLGVNNGYRPFRFKGGVRRQICLERKRLCDVVIKTVT